MFGMNESVTREELNSEAYHLRVEKILGYKVGLLSEEAEVVDQCYRERVPERVCVRFIGDLYAPEATGFSNTETYHA